MKVNILIFGLVALLLVSGCAVSRTVSGRLIYKDSGQTASQVTLLMKFPKKYPGLFVFFIYPRTDAFDGKAITDNQGRFAFNTNNKGLLIIQPVTCKEADIVAAELTDSMAAGGTAPDVMVRRAQVQKP